jgi:hypothetical protein
MKNRILSEFFLSRFNKPGPVAVEMPNKLSSDKSRISYAEDAKVKAELVKLAAKEGKTATDLIKEAVAAYLKLKGNK